MQHWHKQMGKVIVITGASSGFGRAAAEALASRGHRVFGISRRPVSSEGISFIPGDVRDFDAMQDAVRQIIGSEGRIDVLINNAGMGIGGALEMATTEEINLQMETNFMGCVNLCRAVLPCMRSQRSGRIINISSIGGLMGLPYQGYYSASKFAIEGFSEALSAEVGRFGISVSIVEPGDFATGFTAGRLNSAATLEDRDYGPVFRQSLNIIEKEENGGLNPQKLADRIVGIVECRRPRLRYVVADFEQTASVILKRLLPSGLFRNILRKYYKS